MIWGWTGKEATLEDLKSYVGLGWGSIIEELVKRLDELKWNGIVLQVKEKFGGLRFYIAPQDGAIAEKTYEVIQKAEDGSFRICEFCGEPGVLCTDGWIKTLCLACEEKRAKARKENYAPRS